MMLSRLKDFIKSDKSVFEKHNEYVKRKGRGTIINKGPRIDPDAQ